MATLFNAGMKNLLGGVSRQAPALRAPNQVEEMVNCIADPVLGLTRRACTELVSEIVNNGFFNDPAVQFVNRDNDEKYVVMVDSGKVRVFDLNTGAEGTVTDKTGNNGRYLECTNAADSIVMTSVNDYTFIMNKERVPRAYMSRYKDGDIFGARVTFDPSVGALPPSYKFQVTVSKWLMTATGSNGAAPAGKFGRSTLSGFNSYDLMTLEFNSYTAAKNWMINTYMPSLQYTVDNGASWSALVPTLSGMSASVPQRLSVSQYNEGTGQFSQFNQINILQRGHDISGGNNDAGAESSTMETPRFTAYILNGEQSRMVRRVGYGLPSPTGDNALVPGQTSVRVCMFEQQMSGYGWLERMFYSLFKSTADGNFWRAATYRSVDGTGILGTTLKPFANSCLVYKTGNINDGDTTDSTTTPLGIMRYSTAAALSTVGADQFYKEYSLVINDVEVFSDPYIDVTGRATDFAARINAQLGTQVTASVDTSVSPNRLNLTNIAGYDLKVYSTKLGFATVEYTSAAPSKRLFVVIKTGVAEQDYKLSVNGHYAGYTTGTTDQTGTYRPANIAAQLASQIAAWGASYTVQQFDRVLMVTLPAGETTFDYACSWGTAGMTVTLNNFDSESNLPTQFVEGWPVQVGKFNDGYYLHFTRRDAKTGSIKGSILHQINPAASSGGNSSLMGHLFNTNTQTTTQPGWVATEGVRQPVWEETYKPYEVDTLDPSTMPHVLVSLGDNKFELRQPVWTPRKVGDTNSSPLPSFVNKPIQDVFFFKNRFGILTEESVVLSQVGSYFCFFRSTVKSVLDDDPIDVAVQMNQVSTLREAVPFADSVLIMSDSVQFRLASQDVLTPSSVSVKPAAAYSFNRDCGVAVSGNTLFFTGKRSNHLQVWQLSNGGDTGLAATDTSLHVEGYVPVSCDEAAVSQDDRMFVLSTRGQSDVYVYQWLISASSESLQNSWMRWDLGAQVVSYAFVNSVLYAVTKFNGTYALAKLNLDKTVTDGMLGYRVYLDYKKYFTGTTITLTDYGTVPTFVNITTGAVVTPTKSGNTYTVPNGSYACGFNYSSYTTLGTYYVQNKDGDSDVEAYVQLKTVNVKHTGSDTLYAIKVKLTGRAENVRQSKYGSEFTRSVVSGRNTNAVITLASVGHAPFYLQTVDYELSATVRATRI